MNNQRKVYNKTLLKAIYIQVRTVIEMTEQRKHMSLDVDRIAMPTILDSSKKHALVKILVYCFNPFLTGELEKFGYMLQDVRITENRELILMFSVLLSRFREEYFEKKLVYVNQEKKNNV